MKNLVLILVLLGMPFLGSAQSTVLQSDDGSEQAEPQVKVLVIPFHEMRYYFSDCDKVIAEESKLEVPDVRRSFMLGLDYATEARFEKRYEPINLVQMKDSVDKEKMEAFYENVSYAYEAPKRFTRKQEGGIFGSVKKKFKRVGSKKDKEEKTLNEEESYTTLAAGDKEYMKLNWKNSEYLDALVSTYEPELIVTINQFEIKTDYARCIDRDLGKYARKIKVHYNVFRPNGKMLYGDVVTAHYESTSDDINQIIMDNFGFLADYIMASLPRK